MSDKIIIELTEGEYKDILYCISNRIISIQIGLYSEKNIREQDKSFNAMERLSKLKNEIEGRAKREKI